MAPSQSPLGHSITQIAESGLHINHGAVDIQLSLWSATDGLSLASTPRAGIIWVDQQSNSEAAAPLVDPQLILRAHDLELLPTPQWQTAQGYMTELLRTSRPMPETRNILFFMLTQIPSLTMPAFHAWAWRYTLLVYPPRALGHHRREAPMACWCRTCTKAFPAPGWRAVG